MATKVSTELLIYAIKNCPQLFDKTHPRYKARKGALWRSLLGEHSGRGRASNRISGSIWIADMTTREAFYDLVYDHSKLRIY
ncbi:hypothetical protein HPB50_003103 [Hyalomma asiaticum]|uniref:Uncharacterized protein n=1 Tax=Hyalomma asiaticum TaxID=266040 RepID=A0ACB7TBC4_HYAAI|nr:hypothetical protein HPB50_003103 [Hyalomma asiaticum]